MRRLLAFGTLLLLPLGAGAQTAAVIAPAENLVVDGLPPIPAKLAADVRRYTESRSALLSAWHPVRRELLISTRFGNTPQIHRVATPLGARATPPLLAHPPRVAPGPARAADQHTVRKYSANSPRRDPSWRAHTAHFLRRAHRRRIVRANAGPLFHLLEGYRRQRIRAALPVRCRQRRGNPPDRRRPLAKRRRSLEHAR